jgi:hypothetical protein
MVKRTEFTLASDRLDDSPKGAAVIAMALPPAYESPMIAPVAAAAAVRSCLTW